MAAIDDHPMAEYRQAALRRRRQDLPSGGVFEVMKSLTDERCWDGFVAELEMKNEDASCLLLLECFALQ